MKMEALGIEAETARGIFEGKTIAEMVGAEDPAPVAAPAPATGGKTAELQALWAEILGLDDVPTDKSFYDLGGDSLSALTAIMKMESLGIEAETARGIFEGKTIAEMAGETGASAPEAENVITPAPTSGKTAELQALWAEILGTDSVPTDKSFYDLGGDSLSALTAIMKMESLGIEAEVARGIFEGKSIADLAGGDVRAPVTTPAPATGGKTTELQALWGEILGTDSVPTDKSFYDLGGDSLSALTAIMKMESLGIEAEVARGIFEGKSIADLAGGDVRAPVTTPAPATGGKTTELQALWGEILGTDSVPTDKSFYDLGGDSLSALTAIMKMESLGIEAEVARGIFEGKTIADLVGEETPAPAPAPPPPAAPAPAASTTPAAPTGPVLTLAETVNAIHAARGVLVLWVVIVHWLPALLVRMGENTLWFYHAMVPAWRFGTPGFAMVFGMGIGALGLFHYQSNKALFLKSSRFNTKLIVGGVLILAVVKFIIVLTEGRFGERVAMSGLFYSAITYYALAMLTLPWIVWLLSRGPNRLLTILAVGAGSMAIHEILHYNFAHLEPPAALEFLKITFTAKYGYFRMTGFVMFGVAIGYLFRQYHDRPGMVRDMVMAALVLIAFGGVGVQQSATRISAFGDSHIWHMSVYAGVALLILAGFAMLNRDGGVKTQPLNRLNAFAIASGILALPIFVGHEVVTALKQLLDSVGVPDLLGLAILLGLFFGGLSIAYMRLMRFLR